MHPITKLIIGIVGIGTIGLVTYYIVTKDQDSIVTEQPITNPQQDTVALAKVMQDSMLVRVNRVLGMEGEEFILTEEDGILTNASKDKLLIVKEDVWNKIIQNAKNKLPRVAGDCFQQFNAPELSNYSFIGVLTYFTDSQDSQKSSGYSAVEIRNGVANIFAGGDICCQCEGDPLFPQQTDAVIEK
jgi:hypothetical protein